jgi:hypothetical protein
MFFIQCVILRSNKCPTELHPFFVIELLAIEKKALTRDWFRSKRLANCLWISNDVNLNCIKMVARAG